MQDLLRLGFDPFFEKELARFDPTLVVARVVGQHRREWDVLGEEIRGRAVLAGKRWAGDDVESSDAQPTIGDWVLLRVGEATLPVIEEVLPRRTTLARGSAGRRTERQIVVANVDLVVVVAAFSRADAHDAVALRSLNPRRIERYLTAIEKGGARALVVVNKADLVDDAEARVEALATRLAGTEVLAVSSRTGSGLDELEARLEPGKTSGFVGLSGVGKSTIVNRLIGFDAQKTHEERAADARGRHTTTHRELFSAEAGWLLIDTPGMREFALGDADDADLDAFTDIAELAASCRFRDCRHEREPGCRVQGAVEAGELDADRLTSYHTLSRELREAEEAKQRRGAPKTSTKKGRAGPPDRRR